ncbi:Asp-tRNA(Asn)/Glu-tRNA(Gln) amidotransferase subunit GatB [Candidatus Wolfebacteria bacterium]|nr:Asp-tRNA(Asn)/Glu-tRNA(Gln) amidotransferase subunit GatB [Candidatus Wolfebacteria bacterium]
MPYIPTIGLEIHVELKTNTKMFCGCLNNADEKHPNINVCPICMGHPGTLPTINKNAVEKVIKLGMAVNGNPPAGGSKFDRKNYFYPDLPKGYQISQYDQPLVSGGTLSGVKIRRIHLEEDTARLIHSSQLVGYPKNENPASLVDYNRSGIPLMELVTEPDIKNGEKAVAFAKEFQLILRYLDISDADMEKGHMRIEANISLMRTNIDTNSTNIGDISGQISGNTRILGTKVEVKNINSFKAVEGAIDYEIKRQAEVLDKGGKVKQETRGWDEKNQKTISQRIKEEAHDYRYFPEPDLPPLNFSSTDSGFDLEQLKLEIPELPQQKRERFVREYGLSAEQASVLADDPDSADFFENSFSELKVENKEANAQTLYNYFISDLRGLMKEEGIMIKQSKVTPLLFAELVAMVSAGEINSRVAKDTLKEMFIRGISPKSIMKEKGLDVKVTQDELDMIISEIIKANFKAVVDYKKGQENALQFLVGQAMAKLKGRANPQILRELFIRRLAD